VTRTIRELGAKEAEFLSRLAADGQAIFSTAQAQAFWGNVDYTTKILNRLVHKGWLQRLQRGVYMVIPLEAGARAGPGPRVRWLLLHTSSNRRQ